MLGLGECLERRLGLDEGGQAMVRGARVAARELSVMPLALRP